MSKKNSFKWLRKLRVYLTDWKPLIKEQRQDTAPQGDIQGSILPPDMKPTSLAKSKKENSKEVLKGQDVLKFPGTSLERLGKTLCSLRHKKSFWVTLSVIVAVLVTGTILWRLFRPAPNPYLAGVDGAAYDPRPTVESDIVSSRSITRKIKSVGVVKAKNSAIIKPEVPGMIESVHFKDGALVKAGSVLIKINSAVQQAQYNARVAEYKQALSEYERFKLLAAKNILPELELDRARTKMETSKSLAELERVKLQQHTVLSPFSGIVGLREVSVGSVVQPNQELITVVNLDPINVDFKIPEANIKTLKIDQEAIVEIDGFDDYQFMAKIEAIDPKADATGHSVMVRASLSNPDAQLRPGMFANVNLTIGEAKDVLMVQEGAVERSGDDEFVYVLRDLQGDKIAVRTIITTGLRENGMVEILEGLSEGYEIVVSGNVKIRDGYRVKVVRGNAPSAPTLPTQHNP